MEPLRALSFRPTPPITNLQEIGGNPTAKLATILLQIAYAPLVEAPVRLGTSILLLSPRSIVGKLGSPAAARRLETEASSPAICRTEQIVLGDIAAPLAGMETSVDSCPARDRCSLASGRIQVVLDVALAASQPCGKKMRQPRITRTDFPHGC